MLEMEKHKIVILISIWLTVSTIPHYVRIHNSIDQITAIALVHFTASKCVRYLRCLLLS